ncbi:hypothetical protein B0T09DRAFT_78347 [Sordaria sp. MPI-SDFR-AT-0083]|nr:hypothetical protein B0T09DRAFT_78347 [Sordaria sp. MPI-SDFR-AT-0083]
MDGVRSRSVWYGQQSGLMSPFFASYGLHFFPGYAYLFLTSGQLITDYPAMLWLSSLAFIFVFFMAIQKVAVRDASKIAATFPPIYRVHHFFSSFSESIISLSGIGLEKWAGGRTWTVLANGFHMLSLYIAAWGATCLGQIWECLSRCFWRLLEDMLGVQ